MLVNNSSPILTALLCSSIVSWFPYSHSDWLDSIECSDVVSVHVIKDCTKKIVDHIYHMPLETVIRWCNKNVNHVHHVHWDFLSHEVSNIASLNLYSFRQHYIYSTTAATCAQSSVEDCNFELLFCNLLHHEGSSTVCCNSPCCLQLLSWSSSYLHTYWGPLLVCWQVFHTWHQSSFWLPVSCR